jgi:type II secretory pathway pseudopilin PulG
MNNKLRGISLIEILFSLAIICVILTIIFNYYTQNKRSLNVTKATTQIQKLVNLSYEWQAAQTQTDFTGISVAALQTAGLLSTIDHFSQIDPWGGDITVAPYQNDPHYVQILLTKIPNDDCINLRNRMVNDAHQQTSSADCAKGDYFIAM